MLGTTSTTREVTRANGRARLARVSGVSGVAGAIRAVRPSAHLLLTAIYNIYHGKLPAVSHSFPC